MASGRRLQMMTKTLDSGESELDNSVEILREEREGTDGLNKENVEVERRTPPWFSGLTKGSLILLHHEVWVSIHGRAELCELMDKRFTRDLQQGARSTAIMDPIERLSEQCVKIAEKRHVKPANYLDSHQKILIGVATKGGMFSSVLNKDINRLREDDGTKDEENEDDDCDEGADTKKRQAEERLERFVVLDQTMFRSKQAQEEDEARTSGIMKSSSLRTIGRHGMLFLKPTERNWVIIETTHAAAFAEKLLLPISQLSP
ncbi:hypothetical protein YC2023_004975 [Brassica napus]